LWYLEITIQIEIFTLESQTQRMRTVPNKLNRLKLILVETMFQPYPQHIGFVT